MNSRDIIHLVWFLAQSSLHNREHSLFDIGPNSSRMRNISQ